MSIGWFRKILVVSVGTAGLAITVHAEVTTPAVFSDHMVLQRGMPVPVWGKADPGEEVTVKIAGKDWKTKAANDGKWMVKLDAMEARATPMELVVAGKNTLTFKDVLVGDVWICSGQSNMEWNLGNASNADEEIPKSANPNIRLFMVVKKTSFKPLQDCTGKWNVCGPDTVKPFSAVGYFFGKELNKTLNVPIGLIGTNWGGTPAQSWTSIEGLQKEAALKDLADQASALEANLPKVMENYTTQVLPKWDENMKKWKANVEAPFQKEMAAWKTLAAQAKAEGKPEPAKPVMKSPPPRKPNSPDNDSHAPTVLFNGMISPLLPYGIKGAIWYQGESNAGNPTQYATLFPAMIRDWRNKWGQGEFPFFFVQLANYMKRVDAPVEKGWAELRESQLKTLSLTNTGMAVIIDIGNGADIHPKDKLNVGKRLAFSARKVAYGQDIVHSGPIYKSMAVEGGKAVLKFDHVGSGLVIGAAPADKSGIEPAKPLDELKGFAIAGADKKFVWAKAKIAGDTVVVQSDEVKEPTAVRYGWANNPEVNLYNKDGLPASPFRTDAE